LHLGHAYSALLAQDMAQVARGTFLLRIEDIDSGRCKAEFTEAIFDDLGWLGLDWPHPAMRQSERSPSYGLALEKLIEAGVCYPCSCTRRDIREAQSAPQAKPPQTATGTPDVYPGTCRHRDMDGRSDSDAIRLNMAKVFEVFPSVASAGFVETGPRNAGTHPIVPQHMIENIGDIVIARKDISATSYHLAVVVDDAEQGITQVVRGRDLFDVTPIHCLLQNLLGLPTPIYHHHRLVRDAAGQRLAKRHDAMAIRTYRDQGMSPADVKKLVDLPVPPGA